MKLLAITDETHYPIIIQSMQMQMINIPNVPQLLQFLPQISTFHRISFPLLQSSSTQFRYIANNDSA